MDASSLDAMLVSAGAGTATNMAGVQPLGRDAPVLRNTKEYMHEWFCARIWLLENIPV